eukprot:m.26096 g.26096  ORF g.26096 m.26096 type:complete len:451 (-) comp8786_c0_seq1:3731-5083(-)
MESATDNGATDPQSLCPKRCEGDVSSSGQASVTSSAVAIAAPLHTALPPEEPNTIATTAIPTATQVSKASHTIGTALPPSLDGDETKTDNAADVATTATTATTPLLPRDHLQTGVNVIQDGSSGGVDLVGLPKVTCCMCLSEAKYKCPGCSRRTCSVGCVKAHKKQFQCDGQAQRSQLLSREELTQNVIARDYRFLEEAGRLVGTAQRIEGGGHSTDRSRRHHKRTPQPRHMREASKVGITLRVMPPMFSKHKQSKTHFNTRQRTLLWTVEWSFQASSTTLRQHNVKGNTTLGECLDFYLNRRADNVAMRNTLQPYATAARESLTLLLVDSTSPANQQRTFRVTQDMSLHAALRDKTIIEFPTILVKTQEELAIQSTDYEKESTACEEVLAVQSGEIAQAPAPHAAVDERCDLSKIEDTTRKQHTLTHSSGTEKDTNTPRTMPTADDHAA